MLVPAVVHWSLSVSFAPFCATKCEGTPPSTHSHSASHLPLRQATSSACCSTRKGNLPPPIRKVISFHMFSATATSQDKLFLCFLGGAAAISPSSPSSSSARFLLHASASAIRDGACFSADPCGASCASFIASVTT